MGMDQHASVPYWLRTEHSTQRAECAANQGLLFSGICFPLVVIFYNYIYNRLN